MYKKVYSHYKKGGLYEVVDKVTNVNTGEHITVNGFKEALFYRSLIDDGFYVREKSEFFGTVRFLGKIVPRFKIVNLRFYGETNIMEFPQYKCHKTVRALRIDKIDVTDYGGLLHPETPYQPFGVSQDFMERHKPQVPGYFVVYEDGYESFSPARAFEKGYTLMTDPTIQVN